MANWFYSGQFTASEIARLEAAERELRDENDVALIEAAKRQLPYWRWMPGIVSGLMLICVMSPRFFLLPPHIADFCIGAATGLGLSLLLLNGFGERANMERLIALAQRGVGNGKN